MTAIVAELAARILICDGATGTMLHSAGNAIDSALPELNLSRPELVGTIHQSYIDAGVDIVQTNTFGASRHRLGGYLSGGHVGAATVAEINSAGVRIARAAGAEAAREVFVAGSVSPAVTARTRPRISPAERVQAIAEQTQSLADAGADLLILETFGYLDELEEAVRVAAETGLPVVAQATFAEDGRTLSGETPDLVARRLSELPVIAIGTNCTLGPQHTLIIVEQLRRATSLPLTAQPNAGRPQRTGDGTFEYRIDGDYLARYARRYVEAGASVVGGCCGTTPTHLGAIVGELASLRSKSRPRPEPREVAVPNHGSLADRLARRDFVVAAQVAPVPGGIGDEAVRAAEAFCGSGASLLFVSQQDSPRAQLGPLILGLQLQQRLAIETVTAVSTWDKSIMSLQADLLGAHALGLRAVVCETGSPPPRGDYPSVDNVWEVDSVGLIRLLSGLNEGRDSNGLGLATRTAFHIGARFSPGASDLADEAARIQAKVQAGAAFLVSRPVYDPARLRELISRLDPPDVPMLLTIAPLRTFEEADYLANEVPDVSVDAATLRALEKAGPGSAPAVGLARAVELAREVRDLASGFVLACGDDTTALADLIAAV
jgi:methionine synthase I (cobalamin-dependent)/5,10-methylenetetrahydrofolate reductase